MANYTASSMAGDRPENPAMAKIMSDTWVNFAATGNPNTPAIPEWKPYEPQQRATMVFDVPPHVENDPRSEEHTSELQSLMRISYAFFCLKTTTKDTEQKSN